MSGDFDEPRWEGDTRPPFAAGNAASMQHGVHSDQKLRPIVDELLAWAAVHLPWATAPSVTPTIEAWAWAEARCRLYRQWFDRKGHHDDDGEPLPGLERWDRIETRAETLRTQLGIGPLALAKLLGQLGSIDAPAANTALEALIAEGRAIRVRAEGRRALAGADTTEPASTDGSSGA